MGSRWSSLLLLLALTACAGPRTAPEDPAAGRSISFTIPELEPGTPVLRYAVLGDWGSGLPGQKVIAEALAKRAAAVPLDGVITVGDNFYPVGVGSTDDPQWQTSWREVYRGPGLDGLPWHPTLGNHDYNHRAQAQVEFSEVEPRWRLPAKTYTFTVPLGEQTVEFFALDTENLVGREERKGGRQSQLAWLETQLRRSRADWKIVFGHHPLYSHSRRGNHDDMRDAVEELFVRHGVHLYLAGHDHVLEMLRPHDGVHYAISGAGAGIEKAYEVEWTDESFYASTGGGFVLLRVAPDHLVLEFVRADARTQYAHVIRRR